MVGGGFDGQVRRPSMPVESPYPVGSHDKVADIPRKGKAASVVDSTSGYGSGGSISASESEVESEAESLQSASQSVDESRRTCELTLTLVLQ